MALADAPSSGCLTPPQTPQPACPPSPARARPLPPPSPAPAAAGGGGVSLCRRTSQIRLNNAPTTPRSLLVARQPALPTHMRDQALALRPSSAPSSNHWDAPAGPMPGSPAKRVQAHRFDGNGGGGPALIVNRRLRELNGADQGPPHKVLYGEWEEVEGGECL